MYLFCASSIALSLDPLSLAIARACSSSTRARLYSFSSVLACARFLESRSSSDIPALRSRSSRARSSRRALSSLRISSLSSAALRSARCSSAWSLDSRFLISESLLVASWSRILSIFTFSASSEAFSLSRSTRSWYTSDLDRSSCASSRYFSAARRSLLALLSLIRSLERSVLARSLSSSAICCSACSCASSWFTRRLSCVSLCLSSWILFCSAACLAMSRFTSRSALFTRSWSLDTLSSRARPLSLVSWRFMSRLFCLSRFSTASLLVRAVITLFRSLASAPLMPWAARCATFWPFWPVSILLIAFSRRVSSVS
eukprot:comp22293_c0_seq1/m.53312 comp22293_c0_seq1/g.53312  ORF comp22293_c0_seq1/g.53312 comp22293_c0_seq1/m.53312 type:complete len:315 (-) comp22293_c0_seq1:1247-2191(-)